MDFVIPEYPGLSFGSLYCIGRNYAMHAAEMNSKVPEEPVVFLKPRSSLLFDGGTIILPGKSNNVHHEVELVLLIGKMAKHISQTEADSVIRAFAIGLDITARDLQSSAKQKGLPWSLAKGFDTFSPVGRFVEKGPETDLRKLDIEVRVNDETRQKGNTSDMIFPVSHIVSWLSHQFTLYPGDLIFTGTPEGVGPIQPGDQISATLCSSKELSTLQVDVQK